MKIVNVYASKSLDEEYNKLLKVRVDYQGKQQWYLKPEYTKKGSSKNKGHYIFRGSDEEFKKFLMRLKASDTDSDPASKRNVKYMDIINNMKKPKRTYIWVYLSKWKSANVIKQESKIVKTNNIIRIQKEFEIPNTNIVLEKGDKIKVI